jgi:hypothetical protein
MKVAFMCNIVAKKGGLSSRGLSEVLTRDEPQLQQQATADKM